MITIIKMTIYFGSHIGAAKGTLIRNLKQALEKDAHVVQIFAGSPLSRMTEKTFDEKIKAAPEIKKFITENDMKIFIHSPYTLNFAKDANTEEPYWINALFKELQIAQAMGAEGCVLHMGKAVGKKAEVAEKNMYDNLNAVIDLMDKEKLTVKVFVETSAGQGSELYPTKENSIKELVRFWKQFNAHQKKYLGLCVDTCHIYAAGYDIGTKEQVETFFKDFEKEIGLKHLGIVHINNSLGELGCCADRHACLQYGKIHFDGIVAFVLECYLKKIPIVLETPGAIAEVPLLKEISDLSNKN
jgi:deoxyribonuclease-4